MPAIRVILGAMFLGFLMLSACGSQPGAPSPVSTPGVEGAATLIAAAVTPSPAPTRSPVVPTGGGAQVTPAPSASARDTTPPVVALSADPTAVSWLESATVSATAQDSIGVVGLEVTLGDQLLATASDGELSFDLIPGALDGVTPGGAYTLTARAIDAAGNVGQATLAVTFGPLPATPTAEGEGIPGATVTATTYLPKVTGAGTPAPTPTPTPTRTGGGVTYRVTEITLPTYPYAAFLREVTDPNLGDYPVTVLDRAAYEASNPRPVPTKHRLIVLENRYLRLGILPDLGGRIYEVTFKPTGNNEFYSNSVVKPTSWGPPNPPAPAGANWWLAAGGLEWGFPVEEHGYEFGKPWGFDHVTLPNGAIMLTLFTRHGPQLPYAVVDVIVPPDAAYFVVQPRITNPWGAPFKFKWWDNAMLAPGAATEPGPDLRIIFPGSEVTVHSTGDPTLPGAGQPMTWPVYNGRDFSQMQNWTQYLGVFQRPAANGNFMGVYDTAADEGILRVYPNDVARGAKVFAPGWSDPLDPVLWTDDGSKYVELHGGLMPTFGDWYELPPGGEVTWSEIWYPVAGIGGVTQANEDAALAVRSDGNTLHIGIFPTSAFQGQVTIAIPGMDPVVRSVDIDPAQPLAADIALAAGVPAQAEVIVTLENGGGEQVFTAQAPVQLR